MAAPVIEASRLLLRPWRDEDLDPWCAMSADPAVMEFFPSTLTRERALELAAMVRERLEQKGYGWWVMELKERPGFAGVLALQDVPFEAPFTPAREVGWRLPTASWGRGLATEGAAALIAYAFDTLAWDEIVAMTAAINERSQRVMRRLGMVRDLQNDFDHPRLEKGHRLAPHVLYRLRRHDRSGRP